MSAAMGEAFEAGALAVAAAGADTVEATVTGATAGALDATDVAATIVSGAGVWDHAIYPTPAASTAAVLAPSHSERRLIGGLPLDGVCSAERIFRSPSVEDLGVVPNSVGGPIGHWPRESLDASTFSSSCFGAGRVGPDCRREGLLGDSPGGTP